MTLANYSSRLRREILKQDMITEHSSKNYHLYYLQNFFIAKINEEPTNIQTIKNTFLLAIKVAQESVNHEGQAYFQKINYYGAINEDLLKTLLTNYKAYLEDIVVHRNGLGDTKINLTSLFIFDFSNYTTTAIDFRDFIKSYSYQKANLRHSVRYEGFTVNNMRNGQGSYSYPNGDKYVGTWLNDRKHGPGTYYVLNGPVKRGEWLVGKINGNSTITFPNGEHFAGNLVNGLKEGQGIYYFPNGDRLEGNWVKDRFEGKNTYIIAPKNNLTAEKKYTAVFKKNRSLELERILLSRLITDELTTNNIDEANNYCQNMLQFQENNKTEIPNIGELSILKEMQSFYSSVIVPNQIPLAELKLSRFVLDIESRNPTPNTENVLVLNSDQGQHILPVSYFLNTMVTNLISCLIKRQTDPKSYQFNPFNKIQIKDSILTKKDLQELIVKGIRCLN